MNSLTWSSVQIHSGIEGGETGGEGGEFSQS